MIYLDHHSTTPLAPEALQAMLPFFTEHFANAGSLTHEAGRTVREQVDAAVAEIADGIGATQEEIVVTSGATESNNLALFGVCLHPRQRRRKVISVVTEHKAMLDPLARLEGKGFQVELLPVEDNQSVAPGRIDLGQLAEVIDDATALVSVMLANNEIGTIQPLREIAEICREHGTLLHTDATQAVGRIPVNVDDLGVDLLSFSAHKFNGPKGVGGLFVRRRERRVRLQSQIVGGGQQSNLRSGTLNTAGTIGMSAALRSCLASQETVSRRLMHLRGLLFERLHAGVPGLKLNGPVLESQLGETETVQRLPGNLNCSFFPLEGQSLMLTAPELAVSSGSACTTADPQASHVLMAIGLTESEARSSLRFGVGRTNTEAEVEQAAKWIVAGAQRLLEML